jgi:phage recombination protein Bet
MDEKTKLETVSRKRQKRSQEATDELVDITMQANENQQNAINEKVLGTSKALESVRQAFDVMNPKYRDLIINKCIKPYAKTRDGNLIEIQKEDTEYFFAICALKRLNPLDGDIYAIPFKGSIVPVTSHKAYLTNAQRHVGYRGIESRVVYEKDAFVILPSGQIQHTSHPFHGGAIIGAWAQVKWMFPEGKEHVYTAVVKINAFNKGNEHWLKMPDVMIAKVARVHALRLAVPTFDLYIEEELNDAPIHTVTYTSESIASPLQDRKVAQLPETSNTRLPAEVQTDVQQTIDEVVMQPAKSASGVLTETEVGEAQSLTIASLKSSGLKTDNLPLKQAALYALTGRTGTKDMTKMELTILRDKYNLIQTGQAKLVISSEGKLVFQGTGSAPQAPLIGGNDTLLT